MDIAPLSLKVPMRSIRGDVTVFALGYLYEFILGLHIVTLRGNFFRIICFDFSFNADLSNKISKSKKIFTSSTEPLLVY